MKRVIAALTIVICLLGLAPRARAGAGLYVRTDCTTIENPVVGQTWCLDATTLVPSSSTEPLIDRENITLVSGGVTATSPPATGIAAGEEFEINATQPAGTNSYGFTVAAGAGVTLDVSAMPDGQSSCTPPTSGASTTAHLWEVWWYDANDTTLALMSCTWTGAPAAGTVSSGTLIPRYAQETSNATASIIEAGSGMTVTQVN